ncbi:hypothetical protein Peur_022500 [Populus x canadensis]
MVNKAFNPSRGIRPQAHHSHQKNSERKVHLTNWSPSVREIMVEEVKEINSNSKTKGLVYWTGLVPHGGIRNAIQNQQGRMTGPTRRSRKWTGEEEDDLIRELVEIHGNKKWSQVAKHLTGRIGKQCRERYLDAFQSA